MSLPNLPPMTLRDLRLWHWRKVLSFRATALRHEAYVERWEAAYPGRVCRYNRTQAKNSLRLANFHLGAVQALNDVLDGTAERDLERMPLPGAKS